MKKALCMLTLLASGFAMIGCEASVKTGDPDKSNMSSGSSYEKKTTTVKEPNGDTSTKTEMKSSS